MKVEMGGLLLLATVVFFTLKIAGVINWSWWLVFLPLLVGAGLWLIGVIVVVIVAIAAYIFSRF